MFCVVVVKPQEDGGATEQLYAEIRPAVDGANYIIKHMRNKNDYNEVRQTGIEKNDSVLDYKILKQPLYSPHRRKITGAASLAPWTVSASSW